MTTEVEGVAELESPAEAEPLKAADPAEAGVDENVDPAVTGDPVEQAEQTEPVTESASDDGPGEDEKPDAGPMPDWIGQVQGLPEDLKGKLKQYPDNAAALRGLHDRLSRAQTQLRNRGKNINVPGEGATEEQRAAFDESIGVKASLEDYEIQVAPPEGLELSEATGGMLQHVQQKMLEAGGFAASGDTMNAVTSVFYDFLEESEAIMQRNAKEQNEATQRELNQLWGPDYEANMKLLKPAAEALGGKEAASLLGRRFEDGTTLGDSLPFIQMMAQYGRQMSSDDPLFAEIVRDSSTNTESLKTQIDAIYEDYNKGASGDLAAKRRYESAETQKRLEGLLQAQARLSAA